MDKSSATLHQYDKLSPFEIKDKLISMAQEHAQKAAAAMLNAGRGNPNWVATTPGRPFSPWASSPLPNPARHRSPRPGRHASQGWHCGQARGLARRPGPDPRNRFPPGHDALCGEKIRLHPDAFVFELVDSLIADNYPVPDRMLAHNEKVVHAYLMWSMCCNQPTPGHLRSVRHRRRHRGHMLCLCVPHGQPDSPSRRHHRPGDPHFLAYLEIPALSDYRLQVVPVMATGRTSINSATPSWPSWRTPRSKPSSSSTPATRRP